MADRIAPADARSRRSSARSSPARSIPKAVCTLAITQSSSREQLVLVVERAVGQDVDLAARQQLDALDRVRSPPARARSARAAARARRRCRSRGGGVVGDREVLVAALARRPAPSPRSCCGRRRRSCGCAGRRGRPRARSARGRPCRRRRAASQLAAILAQLRLDVGEAEQLVHLVLGRAAAASRRWRRRACRTRRRAGRGARRARAAPRCGAPEPVKCCSRLPSCGGRGDPQVDARRRCACAPWRRPCRPS